MFKKESKSFYTDFTDLRELKRLMVTSNSIKAYVFSLIRVNSRNPRKSLRVPFKA
jgi:hypothetical protein